MPVFHQRFDLRGRNGDAGQCIGATEIKRNRFARGKRHRAGLRKDHTLIAHFRRKQCNIASHCSCQLTIVHHGTGSTVANKG